MKARANRVKAIKEKKNRARFLETINKEGSLTTEQIAFAARDQVWCAIDRLTRKHSLTHREVAVWAWTVIAVAKKIAEQFTPRAVTVSEEGVHVEETSETGDADVLPCVPT